MDALTQRQWKIAQIDVMGGVLFLGQQFLDLEKQYPFIPKEILIEATWSKWRTLSHERRGAFTRVALFRVAILESADMVGAHYRARVIFKDSHPMAMYLPDKLQELSIADPMPRAVAAMGTRFT